MKRILIVLENQDFEALTKRKQRLELTWEAALRRGLNGKK